MNKIHLSLLLAASLSPPLSPSPPHPSAASQFTDNPSPPAQSRLPTFLSHLSLSYATVAAAVGDDAITLQRVKIGSLKKSGYTMIGRRRWWVCTVAAVVLLSSCFLFFFFFSPLSFDSKHN